MLLGLRKRRWLHAVLRRENGYRAAKPGWLARLQDALVRRLGAWEVPCYAPSRKPKQRLVRGNAFREGGRRRPGIVIE